MSKHDWIDGILTDVVKYCEKHDLDSTSAILNSALQVFQLDQARQLNTLSQTAQPKSSAKRQLH